MAKNDILKLNKQQSDIKRNSKITEYSTRNIAIF